MSAVERALAILGIAVGLAEAFLVALSWGTWRSRGTVQDRRQYQTKVAEAVAALGLAAICGAVALVSFDAAHLAVWKTFGLVLVLFPVLGYVVSFALDFLSKNP